MRGGGNRRPTATKDLLTDPELANNITEPLKSQRVYAMREDGSIQVRLKITTKPGEQFVVRRTVFERVKQAFAGERH